MKQTMTNARKCSLVALFSLTALASCKKKETTSVTPNPTGQPSEVPVLRDGAGFSQKLSMMVNVTAGVNSVPGTIGIHDFSVDKTSQFNILYFTGYQSQQDYLTLTERAVYNLATKAKVDVASPDNMLNNTVQKEYITSVLEFMPYSGNVVAFTASEYRYGYYSQAYWGGYIPLTELPKANSSNGSGYTGGAGYYNVYTDLGTSNHYMTINPKPSNAIPLIYAHFEYKTPALQGAYLANFPEPRYQGQGTPVVITVCKDSVVAYQITTYPATSGVGVYTKTGQLTPAGFDATQEYATMRHYNTAGTKMAMMVYGKTTKQYWTYTYDLAANTLSAALSAADLPYSGTGTDIDMDEDGNIYYTGTSGNGAGAGVSIYKRSTSGATLVGTDDFLKFGEVAKLHYIDGKVNIVVMGKVTGTSTWHQLCLISQK